MTKKSGCNSCNQKRKREQSKSAELLVKGINADMTFEEAVSYAGLDINNLAGAYEILRSESTPEELTILDSKIEWG